MYNPLNIFHNGLSSINVLIPPETGKRNKEIVHKV